MFKSNRPDKDFDWYQTRLNEGLGEMQRQGQAVSDLGQVVRKHGAAWVVQMTDGAIAQALEHAQRSTHPNWRAFRGVLRAEQAKRAEAEGRSMFRLGLWALIIGVIATLFAGASLRVVVSR